jgi:hypothetical protein
MLAAHEVLMALKTHGLEPRGAEVTIDSAIQKAGSCLPAINGTWSCGALRWAIQQPAQPKLATA